MADANGRGSLPANAPLPGPTNSLLDVPGLLIGQVELGVSDDTPDGATGITAIVARDGALGAVDVRGAAPATRETDSLSALASGERVHAVLLVGRSVFGLAAADGATTELESRGVGLAVELPGGALTIPIVAAAAIFDFAHGDGSIRPRPEDGRAAIAAALDSAAEANPTATDAAPVDASAADEPAKASAADRRARPRSGNAGAGSGATTGKIAPPTLKGGVGHASVLLPAEKGPALVVGAVVVVNSAGSLVDPSSRRPWAQWGGFHADAPAPDFSGIEAARRHTTLVVVGTNAMLDKAQLSRVAAMAHDGLARAIRPAHTSVDGDVVFALAVPQGDDRPVVAVHKWAPAGVSVVGALAADVVTRAVLDALLSAGPSGGFEAFRR
jgi:L-aminopeptidase/D-esterase-like protein